MSEPANNHSSGLTGFIGALLRRDMVSAFRHPSDLCNPLAFFILVAALFPLAVTPEQKLLAQIAPGILWVAALLATLLSLDLLFQSDYLDGTLEQQLLAPQPLYLIILVKVAGYWLLSGLPLALLSPLLGLMLFLPPEAIKVLFISLLLGTPVLSFIGAIGAALTVGLRKNGLLLSLLVLPLYIPVLIFASAATQTAVLGLPVAGHLAILGAMLALAVVLAPLAIAAALRISLSG